MKILLVLALAVLPTARPFNELLPGHESCQAADEEGMMVKESNENERDALKALSNDALHSYVPEFRSVVEGEEKDKVYIKMTDFYYDFDEFAVVGIKMGARTFLEEELKDNNPNPGLYYWMIKLGGEPTEEEMQQKAITRLRFKQWRDEVSSTSTLGFNIDVIKTTERFTNVSISHPLKETKQIKEALLEFISRKQSLKTQFYLKLLEIKEVLERSDFFMSHELIESSLVLVHDSNGKIGVYMVNFEKTKQVPPGIKVDHRKPWEKENHEDGYLRGLDNLIEIWNEL